MPSHLCLHAFLREGLIESFWGKGSSSPFEREKVSLTLPQEGLVKPFASRVRVHAYARPFLRLRAYMPPRVRTFASTLVHAYTPFLGGLDEPMAGRFVQSSS
ncbi:hypothetical protein CDL15_Pgr022048 [Punica granatum]|nr:hypothetical protein CDL15_Pgr022048 [Punica granatum]